MKTKFSIVVLSLTLAPGVALAGQGAVLEVKDLAEATGLSSRQVQMVLGARTAFAEYRVCYDRVAARFERSLGSQRYQDLMAGREITLDNGVRIHLAVR
ncbi:hypothetical protein [Lysobacter solisilvae (ex Woo and Kim 2020)]|uniref:Uncharacterized protein n=1 Tax=Agrilutibacter terrestris TaxID=2865112 RepID=A0A7H0FZV0_9GAMM|nr:hypothetical protein [Lysobacter terrestris]QNP41566.1 hypothetical protein H8B22_04990 [Lysobacter terrestris]